MPTIDTCGRLCPEPLIMTKKALTGAAPGTPFEVLSDNDTARGNLMSYLVSLGFAPVCAQDAQGIFRIRFTAGDGSTAVAAAPAEDFCTPAAPMSPAAPKVSAAGYAVVLRGNVMGAGDDDLGAMLMRSCINSLGDLDALPSVVVMYNSGVMLALAGTDTADALAALEGKGVRVMVCGACVDYFGVKERLAAGIVSNMLAINNALSQASHILYP